MTKNFKQSFKYKLKGIIFDFDGVIVNSEFSKFELLKQLLQERGIDTKKVIFENKAGTTVKQYLERYFKNELKTEEIDSIVKSVRKIEEEKKEKIAPLYPKVREILALVKKKGIIVCLGTGSRKNFVIPILEKFNIKKYFDIIVTNEDCNRDKPFPDVFLKCLEKLELPRENCIVIEDSVHGISAAHGAGIFCIGICTNLQASFLKEADLIVKNHDELLEMIKKID